MNSIPNQIMYPLGVITIFNLVLMPTALGADLTFNIKSGNDVIGKVDLNKVLNGDGSQGLQGGFEVTKKNAQNQVLTIAELEKLLKQDHLNWFQKVTADNDPPKDAGGNVLKPPYIDPPKGGYSDQWADGVPWYWDESKPPAGNTLPWDERFLLSKNVMGSTLKFEDVPGGPPGNKVSFSTFLISDFGNKTYQVFDGFDWSIEVDAKGKTKVTALKAGAKFTDEFAKEIKNDFGYTAVPEPLTILGSAVAVNFAVLFKKKLSGQKAKR